MTAHIVLHRTRRPHPPHTLESFAFTILPLIPEVLASTPGNLWEREATRDKSNPLILHGDDAMTEYEGEVTPARLDMIRGPLAETYPVFRAGKISARGPVNWG